ncbi:MAG: GNAT family N-acetyltransferase [Ignavibacteriales bacterium]|nr:GNAT family N-acetyltransferase [Ignavibacteriales bacterium]
MIIRKWNEEDAAGVRKVLQSSWQKSYSFFIPQEDLDFYLDKTYSEQSLQEMCKNPDHICYVAEIENKICGWLKLNDNKSEKRFYLSSIYVLPEFQNMKIGEELFRLACSEAVRREFSEMYIGVMIQNERALRWYQKLGFTFFEEQPFTMGTTSVPHLIGRKILDK